MRANRMDGSPTPMELFTWPFYHYLIFSLLVVVSFINQFFIRCVDVRLIKENSRS